MAVSVPAPSADTSRWWRLQALPVQADSAPDSFILVHRILSTLYASASQVHLGKRRTHRSKLEVLDARAHLTKDFCKPTFQWEKSLKHPGPYKHLELHKGKNIGRFHYCMVTSAYPRWYPVGYADHMQIMPSLLARSQGGQRTDSSTKLHQQLSGPAQWKWQRSLPIIAFHLPQGINGDHAHMQTHDYHVQMCICISHANTHLSYHI